MKRLFPSSILSAFQAVTSALFLVAVYKIAGSTLTLSQLGVWSLIVSSTGVANLANMGIAQSLIYQLALKDLSTNKSEFKRLFSVGFTFTFIIYGATCLVLRFILPIILRQDERIASVAEFYNILDIALLSVYFSALAATINSGLRGAHRYNLSSSSQIFSTLVSAIVLWFWRDHMSVYFLTQLSLLQNVLVFVFSSIFLSRLGGLRFIPTKPPRNEIKELLRYGGMSQGMTLASIVLDPLTKYLLSIYAGLEFVGAYGIITRIYNQGRTLLMSAVQVVIPSIAADDSNDRNKARRLLYLIISFVGGIVPGIFLTVAAASPLISMFFLGKVSDEFITISIVMSLYYIINISSEPYFIWGMGTNQVGRNLAAAMSGAITALIMITGLGMWFGKLGSLTGMLTSGAIGSYVQIVLFRIEFPTALKSTFAASATPSLLAASILAIFSLFSAYYFGIGFIYLLLLSVGMCVVGGFSVTTVLRLKRDVEAIEQ